MAQFIFFSLQIDKVLFCYLPKSWFLATIKFYTYISFFLIQFADFQSASDKMLHTMGELCFMIIWDQLMALKAVFYFDWQTCPILFPAFNSYRTSIFHFAIKLQLIQ